VVARLGQLREYIEYIWDDRMHSLFLLDKIQINETQLMGTNVETLINDLERCSSHLSIEGATQCKISRV